MTNSFDVIVPCYRYGHFLRQCVESVLTQDGVDVRVLIIDDASPDNTAEVCKQLARQYSKVNFTRHPSNRGHIATYNEGITWASRDYMLLLSADDYLLPGALRQAAAILDTHPSVGFTFGKALTKPPNTVLRVPGEASSSILAGADFIRQSGADNLVPTATAIVRTALQKRVGGYRSELPHTGDMEMWLRLAAHAAVGFIDEYLAVYRQHAENMSLGYYKDNRLADLHQRQAAIDSFIRSCSHVLPDARILHRWLLQSLSYRAIGLASTAFNDGETQASDQLQKFALEVSPKSKTSLPFIKLVCKRYAGQRGWRALQPAVKWLRRLIWATKGGHSNQGDA